MLASAIAIIFYTVFFACATATIFYTAIILVQKYFLVVYDNLKLLA